MVASHARFRRPRRLAGVSIPFIAGQWSLLRADRFDRAAPHTAFQSPSLRGSGRFRRARRTTHNGILEFQSPSLRGSGRFKSSRWPGSGPTLSFNPLHCGAVVASRNAMLRDIHESRVSIPFIAGQWSLHERTAWKTKRFSCFNPLHCGAVVASKWLINSARSRFTFQSPSLRGSGRFTRWQGNNRKWLIKFQSPSLRGSGRFVARPTRRTAGGAMFQSPSLRGSGRFK